MIGREMLCPYYVEGLVQSGQQQFACGGRLEVGRDEKGNHFWGFGFYQLCNALENLPGAWRCMAMLSLSLSNYQWYALDLALQIALMFSI